MHEFDAVLVEGPEDLLRGFVRGWAGGRGHTPDEAARRILWLRDWHGRVPDWSGGFLQALRGGGATQLLIRDDVATDWTAALTTHGAPDLQVRARRRVAAARFDFEFEVFARDQAASMRALFEAPAEGVRVEDYACDERIDSDAVGVELLAPAHGYTCRGRGSAAGAVAAVLQLHARCLRHERIRAHEVRVALAP